MSFEIAFQTITTGLAAIACWFLYDLVREFKSFKSETKNDIFSLKQERAEFSNIVNSAELSVTKQMTELHGLMSELSFEIKSTLTDMNGKLTEVKDSAIQATKKVQEFEYAVQTLHSRVSGHDSQIEEVQHALRDFLYYK